MSRTVESLTFNAVGEAVILRDPEGEPLMWVMRNAEPDPNDPGFYQEVFLICDIGMCVPLGADEDLDEAIADWERATR
jgi:hypothetical protein